MLKKEIQRNLTKMAFGPLRNFGLLAISHHFRRSLLIPQVSSSLTLVNNAHWNKDFKPGPYPKSAEERAAAAKKYGLLPEDYEPYPEEEGIGDYPNLPVVSADARDPFYNWDWPELKRNFNEPLHKDFDMYTEERYNPDFVPPVPYRTATLSFLSVILFVVVMCLTVEKYKFRPRRMPKEYPNRGEKHYTFEPAE